MSTDMSKRKPSYKTMGFTITRRNTRVSFQWPAANWTPTHERILGRAELQLVTKLLAADKARGPSPQQGTPK